MNNSKKATKMLQTTAPSSRPAEAQSYDVDDIGAIEANLGRELTSSELANVRKFAEAHVDDNPVVQVCQFGEGRGLRLVWIEMSSPMP